MPLKASLKKYPEMGLKFFAIIILILGFYCAKTLSQRDPESMFIIKSTLIVSFCVYMLYIITAIKKLIKNHEKYFNSGFNLSIVLTYLLTMWFFYMESEGWWTVCIGLCSTSDFDLFILLAHPFFVPVILLLLSIPSRGHKAKNRFFFGVLLSIPFCILAAIYGASTFGLILYGHTLL